MFIRKGDYIKVLLIGINASYSHTALALDYLMTALGDFDVKKMEFNINQNLDYIYGEIIKEEPDMVGFSTYIWNVEEVRKLTSDLQSIDVLQIFWGGPEVSFDTKKLLDENPGLDIIVRGEGEITTKELIETIESDGNLKDVDGITYRQDGEIIKNPPRKFICNLDEIDSPYKDIKAPKGKMIYYEMSRGCPFKCSYCLSSTIDGVRYFSDERIKEDLLYLMDSGATIIKLVDRTFNAREKFSIEMMNFIKDNVGDKDVVFHTELMAHLISDEFLEFLSTLPKDLFQFEIGIQSSNKKTLKAIDRETDLDRLAHVVRTIASYGNIHQHVDLIIGMPYEDYDSFGRSFDFAYSLGADKVQLGFLKLLHGSNIKKDAKKYGIVATEYPPYEVLSTNWISPLEIRRLKLIEDLVEKYGNGDNFRRTLDYLLEDERPFVFFEQFSYWWEQNGHHKINHSRNRLYKLILDYLADRDNIKDIEERLRFDFFYNNNQNLPEFLGGNRIDIRDYHTLLHDEKLRGLFGLDMDTPTKYLIKDFRFEKFDLDGEKIYGNHYPTDTVIDITDEYGRIIND